MGDQEKKKVGILPLFDPQKGTTVLEPTSKGSRLVVNLVISV